MVKRILTFYGWPLLVLPFAMLWLGITCNIIAIESNGNVMPILNPQCSSFQNDSEDPIHTCGDSKTHAKFFVDRLPVTDEGVKSIGDFIQEESLGLRTPCLILWLTMLGFCLIRKQKFYWEELSDTDKKTVRNTRKRVGREYYPSSHHDWTD